MFLIRAASCARDRVCVQELDTLRSVVVCIVIPSCVCAITLTPVLVGATCLVFHCCFRWLPSEETCWVREEDGPYCKCWLDNHNSGAY